MGIELGLPLPFIDAHQLFAFAGVFAKTVVGDSIKPSGELRFAAKVPDVFVSADKGFLGEVVSQRDVGSGKLTQKSADRRLMPTDQLAESVLVFVDKNSSDEVRIG